MPKCEKLLFWRRVVRCVPQYFPLFVHPVPSGQTGPRGRPEVHSLARAAVAKDVMSAIHVTRLPHRFVARSRSLARNGLDPVELPAVGPVRRSEGELGLHLPNKIPTEKDCRI